MADTKIFRTVFIREDTVSPVDLGIETELVFPGWKAVRNLDGFELGRTIQKANWNFFYLAGEIHAIVLGRKGQKTERQAVKRILRKLKGKEFNCLEITAIIKKRFLGFPFVSVTANSRHIQESVYLVPMAGPTLGTKSDSSERLHRGQVFAKQDAVLI